MTKRLQVLFEDKEYHEIKATAERERMTVAEWVRQTLRRARTERVHDIESKLRAVSDAARHAYPTADIGDMLDEISKGREVQ